jgi:SNF2 family DNA or RNA helicase
MQEHFLRRTKMEVYEQLPAVIEQDLALELTEGQRSAYDAEVADLPGENQTAMVLALITRLKQVCNYDSGTDQSCKLDALIPIVEEAAASGDKVLLFSQYVKTLEWLAPRLSEFTDIDLYHGGLDEVERDRTLERYRSSTRSRLLLASLRAAGTGLNLQETSTVVLFDRWWNPAVEDQAVSRAYRFGRTRPLHVVRFAVANSIEEHIQQVLAGKRDLFEQYVESAPDCQVPELPREVLNQILRLIRGEATKELARGEIHDGKD